MGAEPLLPPLSELWRGMCGPSCWRDLSVLAPPVLTFQLLGSNSSRAGEVLTIPFHRFSLALKLILFSDTNLGVFWRYVLVSCEGEETSLL